MKNILILLLFLFSEGIFGQVETIDYKSCTGCLQGASSNPSVSTTLYIYSGSTAFTTGDIESDFDMRQASGNSRWHKGLDLRNHGAGADMQRGDAITNPDTIATISELDHTGYKYMIVDGRDYDFGYGHIFSHNNISNSSTLRSGNFVLKMSEPDASGDRFPSIVNLDLCKAFCIYPSKTVILSGNPHCSDTLMTTDQIARGEAFAPIGGSRSSSTKDFPVHLHLYKFRSPTGGINNANCMDPLVDIMHPIMAYDLEFATNSNIESPAFGPWNNININYASTPYVNTIAIRATMSGAVMGVDDSRYTNVAQNLDNVRLLLRQKGTTYDLIYGLDNRSEFLFGARDATVIYPPTITSIYGTNSITGISPHSYRDVVGFRPFDNFYFADFLPRIHQSHGTGAAPSYADYPSDSRYNDGKYELKAKVIDVRGTTTDSPVYDFTLDNFKPFLDRVAVFYEDDLIYSRSISGTDPMPTVADDGTISYGAVTSNLIGNVSSPIASGLFNVTVNASEPLDSLTMEVNRVMNGQTVATVNCGPLNFNKDVWACYFSDTTLVLDADCLQLNFDGVDCSGNKLLKVVPGVNNSVPTRQNTLNNTTTWSAGPPEGIDQVHNFCLNSLCARSAGPVAECIDITRVNATAFPASNGSSTDGAVAINIGGANTTFNVEWTLVGSSTVISTNQQVSILQAGIYCWTLTDLNCCTIYSNCIEVQNCSTATPLLLHTVASCRKNTIDLQVSGGIPPYTYEWTHPSFPHLPTTQDLHAPRFGNYCVEVTDACGQRETICQEVGLDPQLYSVTIYDVCLGPDGLGMIDLYGSNVAPEGYTFNWSTGSTESDLTAIDFPGEYCVTISNASNCETTECYFVGQGGGANSLQAVTSKTCYEAFEGTIALMNVSNTLSFQWDNGATGYELTGLDAGQYCVTVSSANCAAISQCFEIEYNCCSEINIDAAVGIPTSCNANNGGITFQQGGSISGAVAPWTFLWNTGHTGASIQDLGPGLYSLTITDAIGCTASENWDLNIEDFATTAIAQPACENESNGVGIVIASNSPDFGVIEGEFKFSWSDGFLTEGGQTSTRDNLTVGIYMVTISDLDSSPPCEIVVELNVGEIPTGGPFELSSEISMSCANEGTGKITVSPSGGNMPYVYSWSNGSSFKDLNNVLAGNYTLTVEDVCGREIIESFNLTAFTPPIVEIADFGGCEGDGWVQVNISHNYEYELEWKNVNTSNGLYLENVFSQFPPEYILSDENGCVYTDILNINLGSSFTDINVIGTCEGLAEGIIQGYIGLNDITQPLTIKVNLDTYVFTPTESPYYFSIGGLEPGNKKVSIINGECYEVHELQIENLTDQGDVVLALNLDPDFNQYFCEFATICENEPDLPNELVPATIDYFDNNFWCNFPVFCGEEDMGIKFKAEKKTLKLGLYRELLLDIINNPQIINNRVDPNVIELRLNQIPDENNCTSLRYCTGNFQIIDVRRNFHGTEVGSGIVGNCETLVCQGFLGINTTHDFCYDNIDDAGYFGISVQVDLENFNNIPTNGCYFQTNKLIEVYYSYLAGNLDYLTNLMSTDLYLQVIKPHLSEFESSAPYLNCSSVRWCGESGEVHRILYSSTDECGQFISTEPGIDEVTCEINNQGVICLLNNEYCQECLIWYPLSNDIGPKIKSGNKEKEDLTFDHYLYNFGNTDQFINCAPSILKYESPDTTFVYSDFNYIRTSEFGQEYVDFYESSRNTQPTYLEGKISHIYSNDILKQEASLEIVDESESIITITSNETEHYLSIAHQDQFDLLSIDQYSDRIRFYGYHKYELLLNNEIVIAGNQIGTYSIVDFHFESNEIEFISLENITSNNIFVSKHDNYATRSFVYPQEENYFSSSIIIPDNLSHGVHELKIPNSSSLEAHLKEMLIFNGTFSEIYALDYHPSGMMSLIVEGIGSVYANDLDTKITLFNQVSYLGFNTNKQILFKKGISKYSGELLATSKLSNNPVSGFGISMPIKNNIFINEVEYPGDTNRNLLFLRLNDNGDVIQTKLWGEPHTEIELKEFQLTFDAAYFGGHIIGTPDEIKIGQQNFILRDNYNKHSFLAAQNLKNDASFKRNDDIARSINAKKNVGAKIYPNPTKGNISIVFTENEIPEGLKIFSTSGRLIKKLSLTQKERIDLSLENIPPGIYFIKLAYQNRTSIHKIILTD